MLTEVALENPYTPLRPRETVRRGHFVGRREIWFDDLHQRLYRQRQHDRHLIIMGPTGIGKTALLRRMEQQALEGEQLPPDQVAIIDLGEPATTPLQVAEAIYNALPLANTAEGRQVWPGILRQRVLEARHSAPADQGVPVGPPEDERLQMLNAAFAILHESVAACEGRKATLILLDQVGAAADRALRGQAETRWRPFLQRLEELLLATQRRDSCRVLFVMAVREEHMGALLHVARRLWHGDAVDVWPLDPLGELEGPALVTVPARLQRVSYDAETVAFLVQQAGRRPFNLQLGAFYLWDWLGREGRLVPGSTVRATLEEVRQAAGGDLLARFWQALPPDQRELLKVVAQYQGQLSPTDLNRLAGDKGIRHAEAIVEALRSHALQPLRYVSHRDRYQIAHDLLCEFILAQIPQEEKAPVFLQQVLEEAPRRYRQSGTLLTEAELDRLWLLRERLRLVPDQLQIILLSEMMRRARAPESPDLAAAPGRWIEHVPLLSAQVLAQLAEWAESDWVRAQATESLATLGRAAIPVLIHLAEGAEREGMRLRAAVMLAEQGEAQRATSLLAQLARSARDEEMRFRAAEALAALGEPAIPALAQLSRSADDERVRLRTVTALMGLGRPAIPALIELAQSTMDERTRLRAAESLAALGEAQVAIPILTELARSAEDAPGRLRAAESLVVQGETPAAIPALAHLAQSAESAWVRLRAAEILANEGEHHLAIRALTQLLQTVENEGARVRAAEALAAHGEPGMAIPALIELAQSAGDERVRLRAAEALAAQEETHVAIPALAQLAQSAKDEQVRCRAGHALARWS